MENTTLSDQNTAFKAEKTDIGKFVILTDLKNVDDFLHILRVLNHYYQHSGEPLSPLAEFRRDVVKASPDTVGVRLDMIGENEFMVMATLGDRTESWIHIDGIQSERVKLADAGNLTHPVFSIVCLTDIFYRELHRK